VLTGAVTIPLPKITDSSDFFTRLIGAAQLSELMDA
jgi:hypothetical protein